MKLLGDTSVPTCYGLFQEISVFKGMYGKFVEQWILYALFGF